MLKKTLAMLLALLMMLSLAACVINIHDGDPDDGKKQEQTTKDPAPTKDPERTGEPQETEDPADAKFDEFKKTATIEETLLYNDNGIVITAKDLTYEDSGVTLNLLLENNRDEELSFSSVNSTSVNGYMLYGGNLNCDVAAGEKADGEMYISYNEMRLHGIYELAELGLQFTVEDYSDFKAETDFVILKTSAFDSYTFNPNGFQDAVTSNAAKNELDYSVDFFGTEELYNSSGIRLVSQTMISEDHGMKLYLEFVNDARDLPAPARQCLHSGRRRESGFGNPAEGAWHPPVETPCRQGRGRWCEAVLLPPDRYDSNTGREDRPASLPHGHRRRDSCPLAFACCGYSPESGGNRHE